MNLPSSLITRSLRFAYSQVKKDEGNESEGSEVLP